MGNPIAFFLALFFYRCYIGNGVYSVNDVKFDNVLRHFFYSGRMSRMSARHGDVYLVVDNSTDDIFSICTLIEENGGKAISASCIDEGKRAIYGLGERLLCVVIDNSHYELASWVRENFPNLPIVLYTGFPGVREKEMVENPQLTPVRKGDIEELLIAIRLKNE
jgi:hypothetical protein